MNDVKIKIPDPEWGSSLASTILALEKLRSKNLISTVPPWIFLQLKYIFQYLETLGSARIEGNNTTLTEYVENKIVGNEPTNSSQVEIKNLERAMKWIEDNTRANTRIDRAYVSELHKMVVEGLAPPPRGEGSNNPGGLRQRNIAISGSFHRPPDVSVLRDYFESFLEFINKNWSEQYQLLMVAIAHHRFAYMHPFDNGNGRVGRLLNYALLIKQGFHVGGQIINPSAIFYSDRNKYYEHLHIADSLKDEDVLRWAEYFLSGLKNEVEKINRLFDLKYVRERLLLKAILWSYQNEQITHKEYKILKYLISQDKMTIKAGDLKEFGITNPASRSRAIGDFKDKRIITPVKGDKGRIYTISFANSLLLKAIIILLRKEGFISNSLDTR